MADYSRQSEQLLRPQGFVRSGIQSEESVTLDASLPRAKESKWPRGGLTILGRDENGALIDRASVE